MNMSFISEKSKKIPGSMIREMFAMQAGLDNVISFALGEPDFTAPQHVIDATVASLQRGETHYTPNAGIPALRQAVSDLYKRRGLDYTSKEVLIGAGAISLLNLTAMAGVVGAGGLGDFAVRYGHDRNMTDVTNVTVIVLVLLVCIMEFIGGQVVKKNTH